MKKCPYCAEMIQDEAIKCRYCHSDLTVAPQTVTATEASAEPSSPTPTVAASSPTPEVAATSPTDTTLAEPVDATPGPVPEPVVAETTSVPADQPPETSSAEAMTADGDVRYTHSGYRFVLGYSADAFGIWDRQSPAQPTERFPRTDDGWRQAWLRFAALEPNSTTVEGGEAAPSAGASTPAAGIAMDPSDVAAVQYTHSGTRYLLGYGKTFFGIWDREAPATPVERFPRDDDGWAAAWGRFTQIESNFSEVGLSG